MHGNKNSLYHFQMSQQKQSGVREFSKLLQEMLQSMDQQRQDTFKKRVLSSAKL